MGTHPAKPVFMRVAAVLQARLMSGKTKRCANRAAQALRLAVAALRTSQSALGA